MGGDKGLNATRSVQDCIAPKGIDFPSYKFMGVSVNPLTLSQLNSLVGQAILENRKVILANHNLHSVYIFHHDAKMRQYYAEAEYVHVDGMALILLGRCLGAALSRIHRVTYVDWLMPLVAEAERFNWRIFYLGSKPGTAEKGAKVLIDRFPNLKIATADGYFDSRPESSENRRIVNAINAFQPNILFVGMGMPRQEYWILDNFSSLSVNVVLPSGATMDYLTGTIPTPPRWAGQFGIEWLVRLLSEPGRLWRRYLFEPWSLLRIFLTELTRNQKLGQ